jgi:hypothetical protein
LTKPAEEAKPDPEPEDNDDPETRLRKMWTAQGVSQERQEEILADITAKAQPGAMVGPFRIPVLLKSNFTQLSLF